MAECSMFSIYAGITRLDSSNNSENTNFQQTNYLEKKIMLHVQNMQLYININISINHMQHLKNIFNSSICIHSLKTFKKINKICFYGNNNHHEIQHQIYAQIKQNVACHLFAFSRK